MPENDRDDGDREDENDPHAGETPEEQAARLIGNSSLGTEGAQSLAGRVSEEAIAEVLRRAHREHEDAGDVGPDDFFGTDWDQVDRDEELLRILGEGSTVEISDEAVEGEQRAADELSAGRDAIESRPLPESTHPDAVLEEHERRNRAALPGPRTPESGGTPPMAISEDAQQIRAVANDSSASGAAQLASSNLADAQFPTIDHSTVGALQEAISGLENGINVAAGAAGGEDGQAIRGAGSVATEAFMTALQLAEQARAAAETASQAVQQAKGAADNAIAASEQFRETCAGFASKHGA